MWKTENVANYLLKGKQIYLEGRIETRSYEDKENQKSTSPNGLRRHSLVLLGGGSREGGAPGGDPDRVVSMLAQPAARNPRPLRPRHEPGHHRRRRAVLGLRPCDAVLYTGARPLIALLRTEARP